MRFDGPNSKTNDRQQWRQPAGVTGPTAVHEQQQQQQQRLFACMQTLIYNSQHTLCSCTDCNAPNHAAPPAQRPGLFCSCAVMCCAMLCCVLANGTIMPLQHIHPACTYADTPTYPHTAAL